MRKVKVKNFVIGEGEPLTVIAGPCVIESEEIALESAEFISELSRKYPVNFLYKSSYDKANRLSHTTFRGPGLEEGLRILQKVKEQFGLPIFTDVHSPEEASAAASVCDMLQVPAFLCRQTDLVFAIGKTNLPVNIKKGQFLAPWDMGNIVEKILSTGNENITLTERGSSFGYQNLVVDFRSFPIMKGFGCPLIFDATHSVQLPGAHGGSSGGQREFIPYLTRAAVAVGCHGIYAECHPDPISAKCDTATQISLKELPRYLEEWINIHAMISRCG